MLNIRDPDIPLTQNVMGTSRHRGWSTAQASSRMISFRRPTIPGTEVLTMDEMGESTDATNSTSSQAVQGTIYPVSYIQTEQNVDSLSPEQKSRYKNPCSRIGSEHWLLTCATAPLIIVSEDHANLLSVPEAFRDHSLQIHCGSHNVTFHSNM